MNRFHGIEHLLRGRRAQRGRSRPGAARGVRRREGYALLLVLMVSLVAVALALAAATQATSVTLIQGSSDRATSLDDAAMFGIELTRDRLNSKQDSVPSEGFATIESGVNVTGGIKRSTWVSRLGNTDSLSTGGEYGVQAEIVTQVTDGFGNVVVRRAEIFQESFARFAVFTDRARGSNGVLLWWALGAQAQGPIHSNDTIWVWNGATPKPQAIFHDRVTTARIVRNPTFAQFKAGAPAEKIAPIPLPSTAEFARLRSIATKAGYVFTPTLTVGDSANATMRIEFVGVDIDGDGETTGEQEGYFRVYDMTSTTLGIGYTLARPPVPAFVANLVPSGATTVVDSMLFSPNCGVVSLVGGLPAIAQTFRSIPVVTTGATYRARMIDKQTAFDNANARCVLGGGEQLRPDGVFTPTDSAGGWLPRTAGSVPAAVAARPDGAYLWPLSASLNANFRGVIMVEGRVAVSGTVRGRVTVATPSTIVIPANIVQATSPAITSGNCRADGDILGLFAGAYILYADNSIQTPQRRRTSDNGGSGWMARKEFDPSPTRPDLALHAVMLARTTIGAENPNPPGALPVSQWVNRGTVRMIGGQIQQFTGQTGAMSGNTLHGINEDLGFNRCALSFPPPYFPTTGRWSRSQLFEVNPLSFSPTTFFQGR